MPSNEPTQSQQSASDVDGAKAPVRVAEGGPPAMRVNRAALASFLVDEIEARRYVRRAPSVWL